MFCSCFRSTFVLVPGNPFGLNRLTTSTLYPFVIESTSQTPLIATTPKRDVRTLELESFADFLREDKEVKNVNQEINEAIFLNVDKYPKNYRKANNANSNCGANKSSGIEQKLRQ